MCLKKTLNDYKNIGGDKFEYILDYIPKEGVNIPVNGWKCKKCGDIRRMKYSKVYLGHGCGKCSNIDSKTLEDYKSLSERPDIKLKYILDTIPETTSIKNNGWQCKTCNMIRNASYSSASLSGCGNCSKKDFNTLDDYKQVGENRFEYILDYIPKNINTKINGWKCLKCNNIVSNTYDIIKHIKGCYNCATNSKKTLKHYQDISIKYEFEYILDYVPESVVDNILGWKCKKCEDIRNISYNEIRKQRGCGNCSTFESEKYCRIVFEEIFECKFRKCRPKFLNGLEYDGYNEELKIAFEYNGIQHYKYIDYFHKNGKDSLHKQQERDELKRKLSLENNITLIEIPYTYNIRYKDKMKEYIRQQLEEKGLIMTVYPY